MDAIDEFYRGFAGALLAVFLAAVVRLIRRFHVPALVNGRNPWGRTFDEASAVNQNKFVLKLCLAFAGIFAVYGMGALLVGLIQRAGSG